MTLRTVLLSIQALLQVAEPDDPQDAMVARQYKENPKLYRKTTRHWAQVYAGGEFIAYLPFPSHISIVFRLLLLLFLASFNELYFIYYNVYYLYSPSYSSYSLPLSSLYTSIEPISAPKNSLDNEFEDKLQQLLTMGILEVWSLNSLMHKIGWVEEECVCNFIIGTWSR